MKITTVAISYSHDTREHKDNVRRFADRLRAEYGIEVTCDCYEEDMPVGKLMPDAIHKMIYEHDKVILVLTHAYKKKADESRGGVGYECMLITAELFSELGSDKFIPIIMDEESPENLSDYFPKFMPPTRKGIFRFACESEDDFIRKTAGALVNRPKNPKPPLGQSGWGREQEIIIEPTSINFLHLLKNENSKLLFDNALYYAKKGLFSNFRSLNDEIKTLCISKILELREIYEFSDLLRDKNNLVKIMDEFVEAIRPVFLMCYAGYLSGNSSFSSQEGIMFDLLSIDKWNNRSGASYVAIQSVPQMLVYVYHHLYGALHVEGDSPSKIFDILEMKLPSNNSNDYNLLYRLHSVTGWIDALGRDCFDSFKYLLNAYSRWDWLKLIFKNENTFKEKLTTYQAVIHILNFFYSLSHKRNEEMPYDVPPAFIIAGDYKKYAERWLIKNSEFFKSYLRNQGISQIKATEGWELWCGSIYKFRTTMTYFQYLPANFIGNLLM